MENKNFCERLREALIYDPHEGTFKWRISLGGRKAGTLAGSYNQNGYLKIKFEGKIYPASHLAIALLSDKMPESMVTFRDKNPANLRSSNLLLTDRVFISRNAKRSKANISGVKGVSWYSRSSTWRVQVSINGKPVHIGFFVSLIDAAHARYEAELNANYPMQNSTARAYIRQHKRLYRHAYQEAYEKMAL